MTHCIVVGKKIGGTWHYAASQPMDKFTANEATRAWRHDVPPDTQVAFVRPKEHPDVTGAEVTVTIDV